MQRPRRRSHTCFFFSNRPGGRLLYAWSARLRRLSAGLPAAGRRRALARGGRASVRPGAALLLLFSNCTGLKPEGFALLACGKCGTADWSFGGVWVGGVRLRMQLGALSFSALVALIRRAWSSSYTHTGVLPAIHTGVLPAIHTAPHAGFARVRALSRVGARAGPRCEACARLSCLSGPRAPSPSVSLGLVGFAHTMAHGPSAAFAATGNRSCCVSL